MCQHCVFGWWTCRWNADSALSSCLSGAQTQAERQQCIADHDIAMTYCNLEYSFCQDYCEA